MLTSTPISTYGSTHLPSYRLPVGSWSEGSVYWLRHLLLLIVCHLSGHAYDWKIRRICYLTLHLFEQLLLDPNALDEAKRLELRSGIDALLQNSHSSRFWLMHLRAEKSHPYPRSQLLKLLSCADFTQHLSGLESARLSRAIHAIDTDLRSSDLALRTFILSAAKFHEVRQSLEKLTPSSLTSKKWQQVDGLLAPVSHKASQLLQEAKKHPLGDSRKIIFFSRKGQAALQPCRGWQLVEFIFDLFKIKHNHVGLLLAHQTADSPAKAGIAHMGIYQHEIKTCGDADLLSADILELSAQKIINESDGALLAKKMGLSQVQLFQQIDNHLAATLEQQHQLASQLALRNYRNTLYIAYYTVLNLLRPKAGLMAQSSHFHKGQVVNCSQYVASVVYNSIEKINKELREALKIDHDLLIQPFNSNQHPASITPKELYQRVASIAKVIQLN